MRIAPDTSRDTAVRITRTFQASRERVFRAWTEPAQLQQWWGPEGFSTPSCQIDLRVGGGYRLTMKPAAGDSFDLVGTYREVRPPERLVYTWAWRGRDVEMGETLVTVEFLDRDGATEVVVTHELLPNEERRDGHRRGWEGSLDRLVELLTR